MPRHLASRLACAASGSLTQGALTFVNSACIYVNARETWSSPLRSGSILFKGESDRRSRPTWTRAGQRRAPSAHARLQTLIDDQCPGIAIEKGLDFERASVRFARFEPNSERVAWRRGWDSPCLESIMTAFRFESLLRQRRGSASTYRQSSDISSQALNGASTWNEKSMS